MVSPLNFVARRTIVSHATRRNLPAINTLRLAYALPLHRAEEPRMLKTALFTTLVTAFVVAPALAQGHGGGRSKTSHGPQVATTAAGAAATAPKGSTHGSPHTISTTTTHGSPKATAPTMK